MKKIKFEKQIGYTTTLARPQCSVPGCNNPAAHMLAKSHPSYPRYRRANWIKDMYPDASDKFCCNVHHNENTARKHGVKTAGHLTAKRHGLTYNEYNIKKATELATRHGFDSVTEYRNSIHPYLKYRKDYCENIDGRLGHKCTTNVWWPGMLQVDHLDGNHLNNNLENLQTLCACCHVYKSWKFEDFRTPGRKTRKKDTSITNIYISDSTVNIQSKN